MKEVRLRKARPTSATPEGNRGRGAVIRRPRRVCGFTLIELTVALALATVLLSLVIVRISWGGPRQTAIAEARKVGNLIRTYRERAQFEEREYALRLDLARNHYEILPVSDRSPLALQSAIPERQGTLSDRLRWNVLSQGDRELPSPVVLYFNRQGVMPETTIRVSYGTDSTITFGLNPLTNEVSYAER